MTRFIKNKKQTDFLAQLKTITSNFAERAAINDEKGIFPFENFEDLKKIGYFQKALEDDFTLYDFLLYQEEIAYADGVTALSIGWHISLTKDLLQYNHWSKEHTDFLKKAVKHNKLFNHIMSERQTGSPSRGGLPTTIAKRTSNGWVINGEKTFATMAPVLDYFLISATLEHNEDVGIFVVPADTKGVTIRNTWDSIALRASSSDDIILDQVFLEEDALVETIDRKKPRKLVTERYLHIPIVYLGIARAARDEAIRFAKTYIPNSLKAPIITLPNIKQKIGEIEGLILQSQYLIYGVAQKVEEANEEEKDKLIPDLALVKYSVTNSAVDVVDKAMRIVGAHSLRASNPLSRYYRDVRAGLHNPPADDSTLEELAKQFI